MCLNGLRCSQNAGKWHFESTKFQIFLGKHAPKPPSLVGANHSCKILDPPLLRQQINKLAFVNKNGAKFTKPKLVVTSIPLP